MIKDRVCIVDDDQTNLDILALILRNQGYEVVPFTSGEEMLNTNISSTGIFLLDMIMPEMNGIEICKRLKSRDDTKDIPVIFISGLQDMNVTINAFQMGGVDYISKPFHPEEVCARIKTHLTLRKLSAELQSNNLLLEKRVADQIKIISRSQMATIFALAKLAEERDTDTGEHLIRVQHFCKFIAEELRKTEDLEPDFIDNIFHASPLHDIGKVGIPDAILMKPGKLTANEFDVMKGHSMIGAHTLKEVLREFPDNAFLTMGVDIAQGHHEKWDGSGYPIGLSNLYIPLSARIMALADVYDALRVKRVYKPPFSHEKACSIIIADRGKHFDPTLVDIFSENSDIFNEIFESF